MSIRLQANFPKLLHFSAPEDGIMAPKGLFGKAPGMGFGPLFARSKLGHPALQRTLKLRYERGRCLLHRDANVINRLRAATAPKTVS